MNTQIIYPTQVTAMRIGNESKVTITATGHEEGLTNIRIEQSAAMIYPPIFMVVGDPTPAIGYFPYSVSKTIEYSTELDYINFTMANGTQRIPIFDVMKEFKKSTPTAVLESTKSTKSNSNRVVGYAYNSSDINTAIADAIRKLRVKFPANVNAIMVESGFVAVGSPVGIAYYYVVMEQK
jgi:hypothetical protein